MKVNSHTSRGLEDELVKSEAFATCFEDSGSGGLSESESGNGDLGEVQKSDIISDCAYDDNGSLPDKR